MYEYCMRVLAIALCVLAFVLYIVSQRNEPDSLKKYYGVYDSKIHGRGCFADRDIPEFFDLGVITVHTNDGIGRLKDPSREGRYYYSKQGIPWREHRLLGRYINHSESPNCEVYTSSPLTFGTRTITKIHQGEELTIDYYPLRAVYMDGDMSDVVLNK